MLRALMRYGAFYAAMMLCYLLLALMLLFDAAALRRYSL